MNSWNVVGQAEPRAHLSERIHHIELVPAQAQVHREVPHQCHTVLSVGAHLSTAPALMKLECIELRLFQLWIEAKRFQQPQPRKIHAKLEGMPPTRKCEITLDSSR